MGFEFSGYTAVIIVACIVVAVMGLFLAAVNVLRTRTREQVEARKYRKGYLWANGWFRARRKSPAEVYEMLCRRWHHDPSFSAGVMARIGEEALRLQNLKKPKFTPDTKTTPPNPERGFYIDE